MDKKLFDVERLKRRINFLLLRADNSGDAFDKPYNFALHQVLGMIESIEHDDSELIHRL